MAGKMNIYTHLKIECAKAGTRISEVCRRAGVNPVTVYNWRDKQPRQFETLQKLEETIKEIDREKEEAKQ